MLRLNNLIFGKKSPKDLVTSCVDSFKLLQLLNNSCATATSSSSQFNSPVTSPTSEDGGSSHHHHHHVISSSSTTTPTVSTPTTTNSTATAATTTTATITSSGSGGTTTTITGTNTNTSSSSNSNSRNSIDIVNNSNSELKRMRAIEELSKNFAQLKQVLYGEGENEPKKNEVQEVASQVYNSHLLLFLVQNFEHMEFEARKDAMQVFNNLVKLQMNGRFTTVDYLCGSPQILYILLNGYEKAEISILSGTMLRECIKHEVLARKLLCSEQADFFKLFAYVDLDNFEVASDAFVTFRELLSRHKSLVAEFLDANYDKFFSEYSKLLQSSYVTKRQSLKLLGEILLDRPNFKIMKRFINNKDNLKLLMNLLLDKRKNIQFEAFHVFKIFVANPAKNREIVEILYMNKAKLIRYLGNFNRDSNDDQFLEEKALLLSEIEKIEKPASIATSNTTIAAAAATQHGGTDTNVAITTTTEDSVQQHSSGNEEVA